MARKPSLRLRTHMSYEELEKLLETHCQQAVQIFFEGLEGEAQQTRKVITLTFQTEQDRDAFRAVAGSRSAK